MPQPRKTSSTRKPMPITQAAEEAAERVTDTVQLTRHATRMMHDVKPNLWQRIWYGAQAERKVAAKQAKTVVVRVPLDEVKAGVLAEMQNISRTQGGVSGSPFANVMLPQSAKMAAKPMVVAEPVRAKRGLPWGRLLVLAVIGLLGYTLWQNRQAQMAGLVHVPTAQDGAVIATGETATQANPKVTVIEWAKPVAEGAKPAPTRALVASELAKALPEQTPPTAVVVQNQKNVVWFSTGMMNATGGALQNISLKLTVRDSAGVLLLERTLAIAGPVAAGAAVPPQRLSLNGANTERFIAQAPLSALRVSLVPVAAKSAL